jgi:hypothetical protein
MTPRELTVQLYGARAAADAKGPAQRAVRKAARDLYGNAPGRRWDFTPQQIAAIKKRLKG